MGGESWRLDADQVAADTIDNGLEDFVAAVAVDCLVEDDTSDTGKKIKGDVKMF